MNQRWIEHMKTVSLVTLVVLSFILTGLLWYSSPAYEKSELPYVPPYIFDKKYNQKQPFQLVSPSQVIIHHTGKHTWLRFDHPSYNELIKTIRKAQFVTITEIQPTAKEWNLLFNQATGLEFQYPSDVNIDFLDAFFEEELFQQQYLKQLNKISRVWIYQNPGSNQYFLWFISDANQKVVQVQIELRNDKLSNLLVQASNSEPFSLTAHLVSGSNPGDEENTDLTFPRVIYIPTSPIILYRAIYQTDHIPIDTMNKWLFKDPTDNSIPLNSDETLYMFSDQLLTYSKSANSIVYVDNKSRPYPETVPLEKDLDESIDFIQRHRGWAGQYLLDEITKEEGFNQYQFRLMMDGLPVYWKSDEDVHPDIIQIQTGLNPNGSLGVRKYTRSLTFLRDQPKTEQVPLGQDQLLSLLEKQKIDIKTVERVFIGYQAQSIPKEKRVLLEPTWFVTTSQKPTPIPIQVP